MSGPRILAAAVPAMNAFAGWRRPVHCRALATIGNSGAVIMVASKTTVGVTITHVTTGQYRVTFPACKDVAGISPQVLSVAPETADGASYATIDADTAETYASKAASTTGSIKFHTRRANDGNNEDPPSGDALDVSFWLDFG